VSTFRDPRERGRAFGVFGPVAVGGGAVGLILGGVRLTGIAIFGVFLFLTYYLQVVKGYSPVTSGLAFLPMIACILLSSNTSSIVLLPGSGRGP
jgi:hypothetical protein